MRQARRFKATTAALAVAALVLATCGSDDGGDGAAAADGGEVEEGGDEDADITIAYIQKQGDQQYFIDQLRGAREAAEELGVRIVSQDVALDSNAAISAVDTFLSQGVDGIAIVVPDQGIGPQVHSRADEAGIPIIASDDPIETADGGPVPFAGFNGQQMGTEVGRSAAELVNEAGLTPGDDVGVISLDNPALSVCDDRTGAAKQVFVDETEFTEDDIISVPYDNDADSALNAVSTTATSNPQITSWVLWGCNDEGVQGGVRALGNAGADPAQVYGVGLGAYLACQDWQAGGDTGFKSALFIDGAEVGRSAVEALVTAIRGDQDLPEETIANTNMVGPDTWEDAGLVCA